MILRQVPILIVTDADEGLAARELRRVETVAVAAIGHVIAVLFEEVGQRLLERQELAGADRERVVDDSGVLRLAAVRPVEARRHLACMGAARVGVERFVDGPAVVCLPGIVAALEQHVGLARVADDEDDVALPIRLVLGIGQRRQPAEINAAHPVGGNLQRCRRRPAALAPPLLTDGRDRLRHALQRPERRHQPRALAAVVAGAEDLDLELRRRVGRDHDVERLARKHRLLRAIPLNPRRAVVVLVGADARELPVERAGFGVLVADEVVLRGVRSADAGHEQSAAGNPNEKKVGSHGDVVAGYVDRRADEMISEQPS